MTSVTAVFVGSLSDSASQSISMTTSSSHMMLFESLTTHRHVTQVTSTHQSVKRSHRNTQSAANILTSCFNLINRVIVQRFLSWISPSSSCSQQFDGLIASNNTISESACHVKLMGDVWNKCQQWCAKEGGRRGGCPPRGPIVEKYMLKCPLGSQNTRFSALLGAKTRAKVPSWEPKHALKCPLGGQNTR